jgi:hypothetical protein
MSGNLFKRRVGCDEGRQMGHKTFIHDLIDFFIRPGRPGFRPQVVQEEKGNGQEGFKSGLIRFVTGAAKGAFSFIQ